MTWYEVYMCKLTFWIWFQLFNGTFASILERTGNNVKVLQQRLEHFYVRVSVNNYPFLALKTWCWIMITSWICIACYQDTTSSIACVKFLQTLRLPQGDILDIFSGIHFMPLDKNTYLHVQCFINLLEASFSSIKYTAFLYNDQLVWYVAIIIW